ncbi:MAG: glycosyltransferase family 4 protein [Prevotella sp.]|nr:glycosyltransferase family 4 protein [Prevotella sp.]
MKICLLTPRFPFPQYGGDVLRVNEIARHLKQNGHTLILVSMSDDPTPPVEQARTLYDEVFFVARKPRNSKINCVLGLLGNAPLQCCYYHSKDYESLLARVVERYKPDIYISHLLRMVPYLESLGLERKSIIEMTDALSKTYGMSSKAEGVGLLKYIYMFEKKRIRRYEQYVIRHFPKVVLVSQKDIDLLRLVTDDECNSLALHTNGVHCPALCDVETDRNKICFIGNMRSIQNQDAVMFFAREVFPLVKKELPEAKFHVVGSLPPENILALASDDIIVTGFVTDLEAYISDSCVAVAPIRIAAGIQNKVLVAMGCRVPVVLTHLISEAIPEIEDNVNACIADTASDIAARCIDLMRNPKKRDAIATAGRDTVVNHYSWQEKLNGYEDLCR